MPGHNNHFRLTPDWKATLLALALFPCLVSLGYWQLDRADEKRQLKSVFDERQASGYIDFKQLNSQSDLRYQPVILTGRYLKEKNFLLDNKIFHGRFGYEILTPFKLDTTGQLVLINRGWLAGDPARRTLPVIQKLDSIGPITIRGEVYVPPGKMLVLSHSQEQGWPRLIQSIDTELIEKQLGKDIFPYTVRLDEGSTGLYQRNWVLVNVQPEKHTAYAVQWFAMAITLLLICLLANTNSWALIKQNIIKN